MGKQDDSWMRITVKVHPDHAFKFIEEMRNAEHVGVSNGWTMPPSLWRRVRALFPEKPARHARQAVRAWVVNQERRRQGVTDGTRLHLEVPKGFGDRLQKMADDTNNASVSVLCCNYLGAALIEHEAERAAGDTA